MFILILTVVAVSFALQSPSRSASTVVGSTRLEALNQLQIYFDCNEIDGEDLSDYLFELGTLSVSVEVVDEKPDVLNNEANWAELGKQKSWATAMAKANFPDSFDGAMLQNLVEDVFPDTRKMEIVKVEDMDWVSHVQQLWEPQHIGDLTVRFPWHEASTEKAKELILEGGAAFGTGDHPVSVCIRVKGVEWRVSRESRSRVDVVDRVTILSYAFL
jgi:ribosomal protein L11 methylase PrmA